jgi:hypothetical protein
VWSVDLWPGVAPDNTVEIEASTADRGRYLGYVRAPGRLRPDEPITSIPLEYEPITSIPLEYEHHPVTADEAHVPAGPRDRT